jgi:hypothetical protein
MRRKLAGVMVGALVIGGILSSCTSARSSLGTGDSSCFLDLPTASAAVHNQGHFVGIHLFSLSQLRSTAPKLVADLTAADATAPRLCVAAYTGQFSAAQVSKPLGRASGALAVAVVNAASKHLLATVIIKKAPLHFGHPHLG